MASSRILRSVDEALVLRRGGLSARTAPKTNPSSLELAELILEVAKGQDTIRGESRVTEQRRLTRCTSVPASSRRKSSPLASRRE